LLPHRLEVALHAVHADRQDVREAQVLGVLASTGAKSPLNAIFERAA